MKLSTSVGNYITMHEVLIFVLGFVIGLVFAGLLHLIKHVQKINWLPNEKS